LLISGNIKWVYEVWANSIIKFIKTPAIPVPLIPYYKYITRYQLITKWNTVPNSKQKKGKVVSPRHVRNLQFISICPIIKRPGKKARIYSWAYVDASSFYPSCKRIYLVLIKTQVIGMKKAVKISLPLFR
jgi:hypothetical protein